MGDAANNNKEDALMESFDRRTILATGAAALAGAVVTDTGAAEAKTAGSRSFRTN